MSSRSHVVQCVAFLAFSGLVIFSAKFNLNVIQFSVHKLVLGIYYIYFYDICGAKDK
jgi:hypothetical protein